VNRGAWKMLKHQPSDVNNIQPTLKILVVDAGKKGWVLHVGENPFKKKNKKNSDLWETISLLSIPSTNVKFEW